MIYVTKTNVRMFVEEVQMTDVEFALWLENKGWVGEYKKNYNTNEYIYNDKVLAIATFKNERPCSRTIYLATKGLN